MTRSVKPGAIFAFVPKVPLVGLLTAWVACLLCSQTLHNRALAVEVSQGRFHLLSLEQPPLLIIIWEENHRGGENWKGGWRWLNQTLSLFSRRKRGPESGCVPCPGHRTICALFSSSAFILSHTYSPVQAFPGEDDYFNTGELWAFQELADTPALALGTQWRAQLLFMEMLKKQDVASAAGFYIHIRTCTVNTLLQKTAVRSSWYHVHAISVVPASQSLALLIQLLKIKK